MVGSPRPGVDGRSGDGKDLAALFQCHPGGDQRPRARARLDDDHAPGDARNQTVAAGEITGQGQGAGRNLGDQGAFGDDSLIEGLVFLRIHHVESAAQLRQRPGGDGPFMGGVKGMRLYNKEFLLCSITSKGCLAMGNRDGALIKN